MGETTNAGKGSTTLLTQKRLFAGVSSLVHGKILCSRVSLAALGACVGFLTAVLPHVQLQTARACKSRPTLLAQKGFESSVRTPVLLQVIRLGKASPTGVASERFLTGVDPEMDLQLRGVNERGTAESTGEATNACMPLHVKS